jgi:DNA-nicking Smr family endonuclease
MFLDAVEGATPLEARDRVALPRPAPSSVRLPELPPPIGLTVEGDGRRYCARAPGVSKTQLSDLRTGKVHAEETLDLHGQTVESGRQQLREFLVAAQRTGRRCVLVVHGKGTHSEHGAPLREAVLVELLGPLSGLLHAMASAAPSDGGDGATYVMLRGAR